MNAVLAKYRDRGKSAREFVRHWPAHLLRPVSVRWHGTGNQVFQTVVVARDAAKDEMNTPLAGGLRACQTTRGENGVLGCSLTTRSGTPVWFQSGPQVRNKLRAGAVEATAEALMTMRKNGTIRGMVIGADSLAVHGKARSLSAPDAEFALTAGGNFTSIPIHRPIDTVRIRPRQTVFVNRVQVSFDIPTRNAADIEFRYTLDGSDPTLTSSLYREPFTLDRTARVKVRPFRKGLNRTPWNFPGTDAGKTISCILTKVDYLESQTVGELEPGLRYEYLQGDWPSLFMSGETIPAGSTGKASSLLAPNEIRDIRKTDGAYAIRYTGYLDMPRDGVYVWHAPAHLLDVTMDAGFDLRLWIDDREWFPEPGLHAQNTWSVAIKKGVHRLKVIFVDFRYRTFKSEYWLPWQETEVWDGIPVLEVSGPGVKKQALPKTWQMRHP